MRSDDGWLSLWRAKKIVKTAKQLHDLFWPKKNRECPCPDVFFPGEGIIIYAIWARPLAASRAAAYIIHPKTSKYTLVVCTYLIPIS